MSPYLNITEYWMSFCAIIAIVQINALSSDAIIIIDLVCRIISSTFQFLAIFEAECVLARFVELIQELRKRTLVSIVRLILMDGGSVRRTLTDIDVDVNKFEKNGSLAIVDSVKGYFGSNYDISATIEMLVKRTVERKSCCSVISDMGSFSLLRKEQELFEYETSLPLTFDSIKCKGFCCYHQANFDRLSENQKEQLFEHHYKNLIITK